MGDRYKEKATKAMQYYSIVNIHTQLKTLVENIDNPPLCELDWTAYERKSLQAALNSLKRRVYQAENCIDEISLSD